MRGPPACPHNTCTVIIKCHTFSCSQVCAESLIINHYDIIPIPHYIYNVIQKGSKLK